MKKELHIFLLLFSPNQKRNKRPFFYLQYNLLLTIFFLLANTVLFAQSPNYFSSGDYANPNNWAQGSAVNMSGSFGGSYIHTTTPNTAGNKYFRFYSATTGGTTYEPNGGADILLTSSTSSALQVTGSGKAYYLNIANASSNVVFKTMGSGTPGTSTVVAFEVQGTVQTVTGVTQSPTVAQGVNAGQNVTVTATLSGSFATGQAVYLRYTTNSYISSTVVAMTGAGTTYTATIPTTTNTASAAVSYYVFTSGTSNVAADGSNADLFTINGNNNGGSNYTYTVGASTTTYSYITAQSGNWSTASTWVGTVVPPANANRTISTGHVVTHDIDVTGGNLTIDGTLNLTSNTLVLGKTTAISTITVNGTLTVANTVATQTTSGINATTLTVSSTGVFTNNAGLALAVKVTNFNVNSGGYYTHNATTTSGGANADFPGTVWSFGATSTVEIQKWGSGGSAPIPLVPIGGSGWGHLKINITTGTQNWNQSGNVIKTQGNFYLTSIASSAKIFYLTSGSGTGGLDIGGNMYLDGANVSLFVSSGGSSTLTITVGGDLLVSNGILDLKGASGGNATTINVNGTYAGSTGKIAISAGAIRNGTSSGNAVWTITTYGNFELSGTGTFTGATTSTAPASTGYTLNIGGNFSMTGGTLTHSSATSTGSEIKANFINGASATVSFIKSGGTLTAYSPIVWTIGNGSTSNKVLVLNNDLMTAKSSSSAIGGVVVSTGSTLDCTSYNVTSETANTTFGGNFTLQSGATIKIGNAAGIVSTLTSFTGSVQTYASRSFSSGGNYEYVGSAVSMVTGTALPTTVHNLTINNSNGVTLNNTGATVTIANNGTNGTLYLTSGIFNTITNSGIVIVPQNQSVSRTSGWVYGSLQKYVSASTNFEVGDATYYTNVNLNGTTSITTPGLFTVKTNTATEHPNIATSDIDQTKDDNSYFTLTNSGPVTFNGGATIVFNYPTGDIDGGATATNFKLGNYNAGWTYPSSITAAANSMTVTAQTTFGDFQAGEASCTFGTWKGTTSTDWHTGTNWCGGVPSSTTDVIIPNVTNKPVISTADAVAKTIVIQSGSSLTMSGAFNLTLSGNAFTNNAGAGGFVASSSTGALIFSGTNATISGTNNFQNVAITGYGLDFGTASTVNGTFTINSGGFVNNSHPPFYACSGTLKYNTTGSYNRGSEWVSGATTGQVGYPGNVQVSNTTTLNYGTTSTATAICGNLIVDLNSSFNMGASTAALTVPGNVTINGAFALSTASGAGGDLKVGGNFTVGAGTTPNGNGFPTNNGNAVYFTGTSGTQVITKTGGGTVYFDKLVKSAGSTLQLSSSPATSVKIISSTNAPSANVLEFANGTIDLQGQTFELNGSVANSTNIGVDGGTTRNITSSSGTGTFAVTGTATPGTQNLNVNVLTTNSKLIFGTGVNVTTQVGLDFGLNGVAAEIDGILQINTNGFVIGHSPDYGNSSTLIYNNGAGGFKRNLEWTTNTAGATGAGYPNNIIVQNSTPLTLNVTFAAPSPGLGCSGYIDIQNGASMDMNDMPYSLTVGSNLTISGALTLSTVSGGDLNVGGNWTRTGTFTQNDRNVTFNGSTDATLTATGGQLFSYVYLNKSLSTKKLTLASDIRVSDEIGFTQGTMDLATNGTFATLLSTATKTARVAQSSSANTAFSYGSGNTGQFIIQRYVPAKRAWRLMSPPISGANATISQAWQEGQAFDYATTGVQASDTVSNGFATQITGGTVLNGFDLSVQNHSSIKYYNTGAWLNPANTNATSVKSQEGWMLFVRGDRKNFGQITNQYKTPTITTLRPRGGIFIGQKRFPSSGTLTGKQVIGNPFASAFDFHSAYLATKTANGGTLPYADQYYMWDPNLGGPQGVGAFVTYTWNTGTSTYDRTSAYSPISLDDRYIPSGAAFIVDFGATGGYLLINETDKNSATTTKAYRPSANVRTNLLSVEPDGSTFLSDGVLNLFSENYNNAVDQDDATKMINIEGENFSTKKGDVLLSIEKRKLPKANDTIFYNWSKVKVREYQLEITTDSLQHGWINMFLEDNYKKLSTPVSLNGDTTRYNFKIVREDSGTFKADRFRLIMKYDPPVFSNINAYQQYDDIAVQWQVANEKYLTEYVVEKSENGVDFVKVGTVKDLEASGVSVNQWLDTKPLVGNNFYRVYGVGAGGQTFSSNIVKVTLAKPALSVYPNPVTNGLIGVQLTNMPKGSYQVVVINSQGQKITARTINHAGGNGTEKIPLTTVKTKGIYQVQIIQPDGKKEAVKVVY
ncbi:hypothetical protein LK994_12670 [Ferruginibacter lapsinanis]|uniref:hypothetical protein n=1 Tax=Ferruginibacter lapsinanis TaxID=563172 RepID=UPI001E52089E|nr:hypothetical protein [Ferruginibacter lapsinanis]UEG49487.1 hypothetical protein LK994_12670 [Ferruginibacter lapsinanis]